MLPGHKDQRGRSKKEDSKKEDPSAFAEYHGHHLRLLHLVTGKPEFVKLGMRLISA